MTLLLEIECDGPRALACLTHFRIIVDALREEGLSLAHAWSQVHPLPRHPDWGSPCRMVFANEGRLIEGMSPPALVKALEAHYARQLPGYQIALHPAIDPNLLFDQTSLVPRRRPQLAEGELHQLLAEPSQ